MKVLAEELEKQFTCFGENNEKCLPLTLPIEKEVTKIDKKWRRNYKNMSYMLQFIDSARLMASSLSSFVNNLSERIHEIKCKYRHNDKICETYGITYELCDCFLEYTNFKDDLLGYKCLCFDKSYQKSLMKRSRNDFLIHTNFLTMITISLFCYWKRVFALMII